MKDEHFVSAVVAAADEAAERLLVESEAGAHPHRELMRRAKLLFACYLAPDSRLHGASAALSLAERHVGAVRALQSADGLFLGGDNVDSPPDSAFTINDVADAFAMLSRFATAETGPARTALAEIARDATASLLRGGIHTPNHRWELSAALARIQRSWPSEHILARIDEWLAEGIDVDSDGFYSERSPNYAAYVSNPSLLALAEVLSRREFVDIVERNLSATLDLIHPDGSVESVHSRRQDQGARFPLAPYLVHYRRLAIERGRGDFAWAAAQALAQPIDFPGTALTELLLEPALAETPPAPIAPASARERHFSTIGLTVTATPTCTLLVYGGSDYPHARRIRSGLANNPTFLRLFAGGAVLDSLRLSRDFFGHGPFRGASAGGPYRLRELVDAAYYQPLAAPQRRADGAYDLEDEGRFSAAMSFARRERDLIRLETTIDVGPRADGADVRVLIDGPVVPWALELAFRPGGEMSGVQALPGGGWLLEDGFGEYRVGGAAIVFGPGNGSDPARPAIYRPGQDYEFLHGTDAADGERAYVTGAAPGEFVLRLTAVRR
ncbi:MAG TPA: hypothetical protein VGC45_02475 [Gryllotalpicola sp.]